MPESKTNKYSKLCLDCVRSCKQDAHVVVVHCPRFKKAPVQMLVPLKFRRGRASKLPSKDS